MIDERNKESLFNPESGKDKLLPKEIRDGLNELRKSDFPFHERAKKLADLLNMYGGANITILDCDVCVTDFFPEFFQKLNEIFPEDFDSLSEEDKESVMKKMDQTISEQAKTRVHAELPQGYFTWCFDCESTMCGNDIEYPENPNWDILHKEKAMEILLQHQEWKVEKFKLFGSTRNRICVDVICSDEEFKGHMFDQGGYHISIDPVDKIFLRRNPDFEDFFVSL